MARTSLYCMIIAHSRFVLIIPILSFFLPPQPLPRPLQNVITIATVSSLLSVHNMLMKQSLDIHSNCVKIRKRCRSAGAHAWILMAGSLWFWPQHDSPSSLRPGPWADPSCRCAVMCHVLLSTLTPASSLLPCSLACRRTPRSCTMPCTWWPWLCSSLSRSLSAHYSATDTSPGALGTASWPSSKRLVLPSSFPSHGDKAPSHLQHPQHPR